MCDVTVTSPHFLNEPTNGSQHLLATYNIQDTKHFACIRSVLTSLSYNFHHLTNIILRPAHYITCHSLKSTFQCSPKRHQSQTGCSITSQVKNKALKVNRKGIHSHQSQNIHITGLLEAPGTAAPEAESSGRRPKQK